MLRLQVPDEYEYVYDVNKPRARNFSHDVCVLRLDGRTYPFEAVPTPLGVALSLPASNARNVFKRPSHLAEILHGIPDELFHAFKQPRFAFYASLG